VYVYMCMYVCACVHVCTSVVFIVMQIVHYTQLSTGIAFIHVYKQCTYAVPEYMFSEALCYKAPCEIRSGRNIQKHGPRSFLDLSLEVPEGCKGTNANQE